jgi:methanogenic corrinoid protein MtbC1
MKSAPQPRALAALTATLPIAAVEREVGLSKDTLRVWERRYGFPQPQRDGSGARSYPLAQVQRLRAVKRLIDAGWRPAHVVALPPAKLAQLTLRLDAPPAAARAGAGNEARTRHALMDAVQRGDVRALHAGLLRACGRVGLRDFVTELVMPLTAEVGQAWLDGALPVYGEHLYSQAVQGVLQHALLQLPVAADARPRVLLATVTGEAHGLGLLMAQAMMALEGCETISLGVQTPPGEIAAAARAWHADVVALSYSGCMTKRAAAASALQVLAGLPAHAELWLGGRAARFVPIAAQTQQGAQRMQVFSQLDAVGAAAAHWRARHAEAPAPALPPTLP